LGSGGDLSSDADEVASQSQIVDNPRVVRRVGSGGGSIDQIGQISDAAHLFERRIAQKLVGDQNGVSELTPADMALQGDEQPAMEGLVEMAALKLVAQTLVGRIVIEKRPEQGLLGFDVSGGAVEIGRIGRRA
jgi:hypothetical protein